MTNLLKRIFICFLFLINLLDVNKAADLDKFRFKFLTNLTNNFSTVEKNKLYRSKQLSPKMLGFYINKYGINTIINLRGRNQKKWYFDELELCKNKNIKLYSIPMSANYLSSKENLIKLLNVFDLAKKPILIHCKSGADRTGEAAALWALEKQGKSKKKALKQLSIQFLHFKAKYPAKDFLIKIWQGREWLINAYNHKNFPKYCSKRSFWRNF